MPLRPYIALNSHWQYKKTAAEVIVTHVTIREVSYIAADKSFSGTLPQWLFLADFQPVPAKKKPDSDKQGNSSPARKPRKPA
jgi:hypothetical protein